MRSALQWDLAGYGTKVLPKGEALGVACVSSQERDAASWTACVAQVAVCGRWLFQSQELTVATDVGTAVNPDGVRAEVGGGEWGGLSAAMVKEATKEGGP